MVENTTNPVTDSTESTHPRRMRRKKEGLNAETGCMHVSSEESGQNRRIEAYIYIEKTVDLVDKKGCYICLIYIY
jgi:hypothetical protein